MAVPGRSAFVNALLELYKLTNGEVFESLIQAPKILTGEPNSKGDSFEIGDLLPKIEPQDSQSEEHSSLPNTHKGCCVVSFPDSKRCASYFSPRLEHSDKILVQSFETSDEISLPHHGAPTADGFIVNFKNTNPWNLESLRLGMRTADCLTWVSICEIPGQTIVSFAHLGWRSYAKGLHFKMFDEIGKFINFHAWKNLARHYLSPSIFGRSYPCHMSDVGKELENLQAMRTARTLDPAGMRALGGSHEAWRSAARELASGNSESGLCFPDLQLLCLLDLAAVGVSLERVILHRVNTAESLAYPSYRHGRKKENDDSRRLVTMVRGKELLR